MNIIMHQYQAQDRSQSNVANVPFLVHDSMICDDIMFSHFPPVEVVQHQSIWNPCPDVPPYNGHLQHPLQENSSTILSRITLQYRSIVKKWMTGIHGTVNKYLKRWRHLEVLFCLTFKPGDIFNKINRFTKTLIWCHATCPTSQETCTNWVPFPQPTVAKRSEILPDPNQIHPESAIFHCAGMMPSMFQDKLLTWWGEDGPTTPNPKKNHGFLTEALLMRPP